MLSCRTRYVRQFCETNSTRQISTFKATNEFNKTLRLFNQTADYFFILEPPIAPSGKIPFVRLGGRRILFHWPSVEAALLRYQRGDDL
jgi:hypothetical protein